MVLNAVILMMLKNYVYYYSHAGSLTVSYTLI